MLLIFHLLNCFSTTSAYNETQAPNYEYLHKSLLTQNGPRNKKFPYRKDFLELTKMVISFYILGGHKLVQVFSFSLEDEAIYLYNSYKHLPKTDERKTL